MATIQPEGEKMRQALKWISQEIESEKERPLSGLINDASIRFNLSPKDEEFLNCFYKQAKTDGSTIEK